MQGKQGERRVHFGVFEADLDAAELFKNGMKLRLTEQPFQLLAVLLERPGELVSREELRRRLWAEDTNVDFDRSLNTAASKLRDALGDSAETPRYVQTLPKRGYRFIAPVNEVLASASQKQPLLGRYKNQVTVGAAALLVLVALYAWWRLPFPIPRVVRIVQLSNDGLGKATALATDGPRIYFMASQGASHFLAQIADAGGDTELIPLRSFGPERSGSVRGISHDHQRLLVAAQTSRLGPDFSLWSITPIRPAGRSLGIAAHDADWSPDGRHITYVLFQDLWVADSDGRNAHKLVQDGRILSSPRWAPDGKRIRFTAMSPSARLWRAPEEGVILEIAADGGPVRRVFPERTADHWDGRWTHDGNYFVFNSGSDIWAVRGTKGSKPFQLTYGPLQFRAPTPSPDGRRLYTIGAARRGELLRYDIQREQFVPVFGGLSADNLSYSPNSEWFVYVTYPQGELWRSRMDRGQRQQLTTAPMKVMLPRWSPDGRQILFSGKMPGLPWKEYLIGAEGGTSKEIAPGPNPDATWSPDGRRIVVASATMPVPRTLMFVDVHTGNATSIPGSSGMYAPRWSPDGRYISASRGRTTSMLFDVAAQTWSEIGPFCSWRNWKADSTGFVCINYESMEIYRFDLRTRQFRTLVSLPPDRFTGNAHAPYLGLAPDGSPLVLREVGSEEIYALEWSAR